MAKDPVEQDPQPRLTSASDRVINLFGELPEMPGAAYETRMGLSLRRHTFAEEGADFDPDIAPDGKHMVFSSTRHSMRPDLYIKSVDGVAVTQLTADPSSDVQPAFSPDGTQVAFASNRSGNWDIWIMDVDGGQPLQVTDSPSHDVCPSWSPDGKSVVYCSLPANNGQWELWVSDVAAGGNRTFVGYGTFPEWSPAGQTILYQRARQRGSRWFSIWTTELVDGEPRYPTEVASSPDFALILPTWSADGQYIAYCAVAASQETIVEGEGEEAIVIRLPETADIWMVAYDGRGRTRLTDGYGASFSPVWAADGRIYFTSRRDGQENVWSLMPVTGQATSVATGPDSDGDGRFQGQSDAGGARRGS